VKSYPNAVAKATAKQLSAVKSMVSSWSWSYTGTSLVADVAYDMFTSSTASGSNENEIMIWLAAIGGAGPISSKYGTTPSLPLQCRKYSLLTFIVGSDGKPTAVATVTIAGHSWNLYSGSNGANNVFSFLPTSGQITSFSGDVKAFFTYLTSNGYLSSSQYLTSVGAGTEPTTGSNAKFTVSGYSMVIS
jgi:xyloglucan-specific endo-beta-1,4-glucanase